MVVLAAEGVGDEKKNVTYDEFYGSLPEPTKTGYTFVGWFTEEGGHGDKIETGAQVKVTEDHTLYAKWIINQYTITFVFNNGDKNEVRTLDFNEEIDYPENVEKTGYTFNGWDNKPDRMPAENLIITAQWIRISIEEPSKISGSEKPSEKPTNSTEYVEVVFGKDFTEDEVKDILDDYTKEGFVIVEFEREEKTGETRVIIKFNDKKAEELLKTSTRTGNRSTSSGMLALPQGRAHSHLSLFLSIPCLFPYSKQFMSIFISIILIFRDNSNNQPHFLIIQSNRIGSFLFQTYSI